MGNSMDWPVAWAIFHPASYLVDVAASASGLGELVVGGDLAAEVCVAGVS
jgi:hypothetical protein